MSRLNPEKLHIVFSAVQPAIFQDRKRRYTLTHSDASGDLYLTIGENFDQAAISGWYTRLMRDEVLAEWIGNENGAPELHVYCHVSGGPIIGSAGWRDQILRSHMPLVLQALCWGDRVMIARERHLLEAPIWVHFRSHRPAWDKVECWGTCADYRPGAE